MIAPLASIEILLVEDNPGDVRLTQEGFARARLHNRMWLAPDGETAISMLRHEPPHEDAPEFDLVLLDLNLPGFSGLDVLHTMKRDPQLRSVPVVVLSSSSQQRDIAASYDGHANCYVTKPSDFDGYVDVVHAIESFWTTVARLPSHD
ncbi:MAG: response regulator [Thermoleophilia bacterium]|nr:response regulator [Thermoleophilia bacterium]